MSKRTWTVQGRVIRLRVPGGAWCGFRLTDHALRRCRERDVSIHRVAAVVRRVRLRLPAILAEHGRTTVVLPSWQDEAALVVALSNRGGTIITVLRYPDMVLPDDLAVIDWRDPMPRRAPRGRIAVQDRRTTASQDSWSGLR